MTKKTLTQEEIGQAILKHAIALVYLHSQLSTAKPAVYREPKDAFKFADSFLQAGAEATGVDLREAISLG